MALGAGLAGPGAGPGAGPAPGRAGGGRPGLTAVGGVVGADAVDAPGPSDAVPSVADGAGGMGAGGGIAAATAIDALGAGGVALAAAGDFLVTRTAISTAVSTTAATTPSTTAVRGPLRGTVGPVFPHELSVIACVGAPMCGWGGATATGVPPVLPICWVAMCGRGGGGADWNKPRGGAPAPCMIPAMRSTESLACGGPNGRRAFANSETFW